MLRIPRPALTLLAGIMIVAVGACSSASSTPLMAGSSAAPAASGAAASVAANPNDPNAILSAAISGGSAIKSFHLKLEVAGTIKKEILQSEGGSSGKMFTSDVKLDGTSLEGDVDLANSAAHLVLTVAPLAMLGNVPINGDVILQGGALYYKVSMLGPKYTKMDLGSLSSLAGGLPVAVPTPGASAMNVTDELNKLKAQMDAAGVKVTLVGVDSIGGQDANHLNVSLPLDTINTQIAAQASGGPAMKIDSASIDVWIYKANAQLAKVEVKGASSSIGNIDLTLTVTAYDVPVTVTAPAAGDVNPTTP